MFKTVFIAAAIVIANPGFVLAQDIFWSFSPTELITATSFERGGFADPVQTGSAYIFSDGLFFLDAIDLNFSTSDPEVVRFTGGEAFNPMLDLIGGSRFDSATLSFEDQGNSGNLFTVSIVQNGIFFPELFDPGFVPEIGSNGAVLLARVDFEVLANGGGATELEFSLGELGAIELPNNILNPSFESASIAIIEVDPPFKLGFCIGDVNLSGTEEAFFTDGVDFFDIAPFIEVLASGGFQIEADCNFDGVVSFLDIAPFIEILASNGVF